jgi:hypothetical protein
VCRTITTRRVRVPAVRPAIIDLRFRGDACVLDNGDDTASLRLGDYALARVASLSLDVPSLNRAFLGLRLGQARREAFSQKRALA